jgi:hypothetical protein
MPSFSPASKQKESVHIFEESKQVIKNLRNQIEEATKDQRKY